MSRAVSVWIFESQAGNTSRAAAGGIFPRTQETPVTNGTERGADRSPAFFVLLAQPNHSHAATTTSPNPVVASTKKHHSTKSIVGRPLAPSDG